ncbi:uncharacterized protein LOC129312584 [Prosopis cineraria]|uniref:uncharacterized protein LOC129312584 n=1 Tax=Prosopis cineraria TaxID=364024 RepID=UPI00240F0DA4|nr:uncharacterized protein LOC129312584 [Prosopis cineraria]
MEETDSKMRPELIAKALVDTIAKSHELREAVAARTEASKAKAEAYKAIAERYNGKRSDKATSSSPDYSLAKCVIALDDMIFLKGDYYMEGLKILKNDPEWREIFLTMEEGKKKNWLHRAYHGELSL